jgi:hypothetical protein
MKDVMKHIADDSLQIHLVRYHNTQAWNRLRELSAYIQMLLARIENVEGSKRIVTGEIDVIIHDASSVAEHLRNAEMFTMRLAEENRRAAVDETITETMSGSVAAMGVVGGRKKEAIQQ